MKKGHRNEQTTMDNAAFYVCYMYLNDHTFHVYKPSTNHAASTLFLFTLETNTGTAMFIFQL